MNKEELLKLFIPKNIEFITDSWEELILQDVTRFDEDTRIKLNRNLTDMYNDWIYKKLNAKENIAINIRGSTRCILGSTRVLNSKFEEIEIKDIQLNTEIFCLNEKNNKFTKGSIIHKFENGIKKTYKVTLKGGKNIIVSDNHPFLSIKKIGNEKTKLNNKNIYSKEKWIQLKDLNIGDHIATPKKLEFYKSCNYSLIELELLGFWIGDGYLKRSIDYSVVCFDLSKQDKLNYINQLVNKTKLNYTYSKFEYKRKNINWNNGNKLQFKKKNLSKKCKDDFTKIIFDLKLNDCLNGNKFIPNIILNGTKKELYSLLSGLINSDGSIDKSKGIIYSTKSIKLKNDIETLLLKLNISYSINQKKSKLKNKDYGFIQIIKILRKEDLIKINNNCNLREFHKNKLIELINNKKDNNKIYSIVKEDIHFQKIKNIEYYGEEKTYDITINNNHNFIANKILVKNSGKSVIGLKNLYLINKFYNKDKIDIENSVCANQKEYRQLVSIADFGQSFLVDENAFNHVGIGSMSELQQLKDLQNITAKQNLHTIYITPRTFLDTGATIGLSYFGKDTKNWLSRFLLYSLKGNSPTLLGYVIFDVGSLFRDTNCFVYKFTGGCTNPNKLTHEDIKVLHNGEILKYSSCIDLTKEKEIITDKTQTCPYYNICNSFMCSYEHKKDNWINRELKGGLDDRDIDRYKTSLELFKLLTSYDTETSKIKLMAKNGKEMKIKIKMKIPTISNTKYTGTEIDEIQQLIMSMTSEDFLKDICNNIDEDYDKVMKYIYNK